MAGRDSGDYDSDTPGTATTKILKQDTAAAVTTTSGGGGATSTVDTQASSSTTASVGGGRPAAASSSSAKKRGGGGGDKGEALLRQLNDRAAPSSSGTTAGKGSPTKQQHSSRDIGPFDDDDDNGDYEDDFGDSEFSHDHHGEHERHRHHHHTNKHRTTRSNPGSTAASCDSPEGKSHEELDNLRQSVGEFAKSPVRPTRHVSEANMNSGENELEGVRVNVLLHEQENVPRKKTGKNDPNKLIQWGSIPTEAQIATLNTALIVNVVCMTAGFTLCYLNSIIFFSAPGVAFLIMANKRLAPDVKPAFYYGTLALGLLSAAAAAVGFSSGFWKHPDVKASLELWAKYILPVTFCIFLPYAILSSVTLVLMHRSAQHQKKNARTQMEMEFQTSTRYYKISGGRVVTASPPDGGSITSSGDATIVCLVNPDIDMREELVKKLRVDLHTLQSCFDPNELARVEIKNDHAAIVIKLPQLYRAEENFFFKVESAGMFLFADKLIVVLRDSFPLFEGRLFLNVDSLTDVAIRLLYRSVFSFEEHLKLINTCSDQIETELDRSTDNAKLFRLFTLEKSLVYYLNAIGSTGRAINRLMDKQVRKKLHLTQLQHAMLEDVCIENAQCLKMAQIYSQVISGLMDARASIVGNNLNVMMKNMNALVIAVAIPSFFAGMGGMSEFSAMIGFDNWWYVGYPAFFVVMVIIGAAAFVTIRKTERFVLLFVDGLPFDIAEKHGLTSGKYVHTYRVKTHFYQYTAAIMTSYMSGVPQINVMGDPIKSDNLIHQLIQCDSQRTNGTKKPPVAFYTMAKHYDLTFQLFAHNSDWVKKFPYRNNATVLFPSILDDLTMIGAHLDSMTNFGGNSVFGVSEALDEVNHRNGKFSKKAAKLVSDFSKGIEVAKNWVDTHDDYLLIVISDHGGTWKADSSHSTHGPLLEGNEAFLSLYNPHLQAQPLPNTNSSEFPLILVTDVASTLSQYLSCASIPLSSFGIPYAATNDSLFIARLRAQNTYQLLKNVISSGRSVPASVDSILNWKKVGPLQAVSDSLKELKAEEAIEHFLELSNTLSAVLFKKYFPVLYVTYLGVLSCILSFILYFYKVKSCSRPDLPRGILVFVFIVSIWMGLCLSGFNHIFSKQKQFQGFLPLPSVFAGLIAVVAAIDRNRDDTHCKNFFAIISVGWLLGWKSTVGTILNAIHDIYPLWDPVAYFLFSIYIVCELLVSRGKEQKVYILTGASLVAVALYREAQLTVLGSSLDIFIIYLCFALFIIVALQPIISGNLCLWHFPMVLLTFILYQDRDRIDFIAAQLPAFCTMKVIATRKNLSGLLYPLISLFGLSLGYTCHLSLGRDFNMTEALLTWPWLPFPTEIPTFLGGSVMMIHKFASFLLAITFVGQAFGVQRPVNKADSTLPTRFIPGKKPSFHSVPEKNPKLAPLLLEYFRNSDLAIWFTLFSHAVFTAGCFEVCEFLYPDLDTPFINSAVLLVCTILLGLPLVRRLIVTPIITHTTKILKVLLVGAVTTSKST
ncbi:divalent metal ion transporter [Pelomyxa schiedti]|nr:divalent metal ion transporter [Pelomyxa schiedti]